MSQDPKERTDDSKKAAEHNLKEAEPLDKQDPTQPVEVGTSQAKGKPAGDSNISL